MTVDAGLDLFKAVRSVLVADSYIASQVGQRVFSSWWNQEETLPLIRMWLGSTKTFEMDVGGEGSETDLSVYVFTKEAGQALCRTIAAKVRTVLGNNEAGLVLDGSDLVSFIHNDTLMSRDADDPDLQMAVVRFTALTTTK